ncbi:MAG: tyrosine-type recombinase/integrase [Clostridiales bacterium]|jgi:integrase|nr:tyrosine-type recombinase/integrase [Clostridiales bacterium]
MSNVYFNGPFAPLCELFVTQKRAAGLGYEQQSMLLRMFDNFCKGYDIQNYTITEDIALDWCKLRPNEKEIFRHSRAAEMQRFSVFLTKQGYPSYLLPGLPKKGELHTPYIFTHDEIKRIFERLDKLEPTNASPIRHKAMPLLIRVLYGCGLRISEALSLVKNDVDVHKGVFHIRHGKNDNERLVPMSASLLESCAQYVAAVHSDTPDDMPFFYTKERTAYTKSAISKQFKGFLWDVGIPYRGKDRGPRVHDLRHTFVCHNLQRWAEAGVPIQNTLPILSKYLGHTSISATQWYLRLTPEIYPHLREICERELGGMYANIPNFSREDVCGE